MSYLRMMKSFSGADDSKLDYERIASGREADLCRAA